MCKECRLLHFKYDDGGRVAEGFRGEAGDCVTRSIAIVTGKPYKEVYDALNQLAQEHERRGKRKQGISSSRTGVYRTTYQRYLISLGYAWVPTMHIGSGCTTHLRFGELPEGRLVVAVSKHLTAVVDGTIHDTYNPDRNGNRCVYGYFIKEKK